MQGKNGTGVLTYKPTPSTGEIIGVEFINDNDTLLLTGKTSICIAATDIPLLGRSATGNIMIKQGNLKSVVKI